MTDNRGEVKWMTGNQRPERKDMQSAVDAKYSRVGERIRHITPSALQCSMFCGGKSCKYDNPIKWREEEMAIKGLYSSWCVFLCRQMSSLVLKQASYIECVVI